MNKYLVYCVAKDTIFLLLILLPLHIISIGCIKVSLIILHFSVRYWPEGRKVTPLVAIFSINALNRSNCNEYFLDS